jgi:hypothetical protein
MNFDWRSWVYERLSTDTTILSLVGSADNILGAGALEGAVADKPFVVILMDPEVPGPFPGSAASGCVVAAHDEPGDYLVADAILTAVRSRLGGQVASVGAVAARWLGDSQDLADESLGTIYRTSTFGLTGLEGTQ